MLLRIASRAHLSVASYSGTRKNDASSSLATRGHLKDARASARVKRAKRDLAVGPGRGLRKLLVLVVRSRRDPAEAELPHVN